MGFDSLAIDERPTGAFQVQRAETVFVVQQQAVSPTDRPAFGADLALLVPSDQIVSRVNRGGRPRIASLGHNQFDGHGNRCYGRFGAIVGWSYKHIHSLATPVGQSDRHFRGLIRRRARSRFLGRPPLP